MAEPTTLPAADISRPPSSRRSLDPIAWAGRPSRVVAALGVALALLAAALGGAAVWYLHHIAVREAATTIANLKDVLADDVVRLFDFVDRSLRQSVEEMRATPPDDGEAARALRARLLGRVETGGALKGLRIESGGRVAAAGLPFLVPPELASGTASGMTAGARLRFGAPFRDETGRWRLVIVRTAEAAPDAPAALAAALIDLEFLQGFFRDIQLRSGGAVSIFRDDGVRLIRWPHHEASTGQSFADISLFRVHLPESPDKVYWDRDTTFDTGRIFAYRRLTNMPIVVGVSMREDGVMAGWRHQAWIVGGIAAALALAALAIGRLLAGQIAQRERTAARPAAPVPLAVSLVEEDGGLRLDVRGDGIVLPEGAALDVARALAARHGARLEAGADGVRLRVKAPTPP
ncbi:MAG TPA: hypothetical protein VD995_01270 [Azospirillum sp.]|nr:hypothetical protein [Azospirillum sp.]